MTVDDLKERIIQILLAHKLDGKYTEKETLVEISKLVIK